MTHPPGSDPVAATPSAMRYRVRAVDHGERSAPDQAPGPRFQFRDEAERYVQAMVGAGDQPMILEKLAAAGCWLPLATLG
jgi:hypothetical protein